MNELLKFLTPQNFAMVLTIFLLVRFEKALSSLEDGIEKLDRNLTRSIDRNSRLLAILLYCHGNDNNKCKDGFEELTDLSDKKESEFKEGLS